MAAAVVNPPLSSQPPPCRVRFILSRCGCKGVILMSRAVEILKAEKLRMQTDIAELRRGIREIDTALAAIEGVDGSAAASQQPSSPINHGIIDAISNGCRTPSAIHSFLESRGVDTSRQSVSTRLQRLKNDGLIAHDGERWTLPKDEGPDDESGPSDQLGPVGRERGYPPSAPEGSIPSGSTASQSPSSGFSRDLDDEIPF
jgi:hypothetical protein